MVSKVLVGFVIAATAGCYSYAEVEPSSVTAGRQVRVTLDREEALRQADVLGRLTQEVQGTATAQTDGDALALTLPLRGSGPGRFNQFIEVPWSSVVRIEEKRFSAGRTAAFAGAGAVVTVAILAAADISLGGKDDGGGSNEQVRVPLFRFAW